MEIEILNGLDGCQPLNGFNRITPVGDRGAVNGFNRINYLNGTGYTINGYELNGYELNDLREYMYECAQMGTKPTLNGWMNGRAERQARRAARQARRGARRSQRARRQEARTLRAEGRGERQADRRERVREIGGKLANIGGGLLEDKLGIDLGINDGMMPFTEFEDVNFQIPEEKGYLFGKPPFEPWKGKWWGSNRVPMIQKVGVGAGALLAVDALTGGNIVLQRVGVMKKKPKKRR